MTSADVVIRPEQPHDAAAVRTTLAAAFGGNAEADLIDRLRNDGDLVLALVAEQADRQIVGTIAFPRLAVAHDSRTFDAVGLAPLAVMPAAQRRGIGAALTRQGLAMLAARGETLVFVLGDPVYYRRFGFDAAAAAGFTCTYAGPYFMARTLGAGAPVAGDVRYPAAFANLG
jgi:putative acetyltransferase